ncbi:MAG: hypothetical protein IT424_00710 [Pirellulales bacterium]|nr:hypothetical protein [Pirellulales bacterium]
MSIGQFGINAAGLHSDLNLKGTNVTIGQVETGRPGMEGVDAPANLHQDVDPAAVYRYSGPPNTADAVGFPGQHALNVAGVMISKHTGDLVGVAPSAALHASASPGGNEQNLLVSMNHVASRNGRDVRAVNMSFGASLGPLESTDGNAYFTRGFDWMATAYDNTLFVVSGTEEGGGALPKDNYNGLVVGMSSREAITFAESATLTPMTTSLRK